MVFCKGKGLLANILRSVGVFTISLIVRLLYFSYRKTYDIGLKKQPKSVIVAFWHGELLMTPFFYKKIRNHTIYGMISEHSDGELLRLVVRHFGIKSIRGSTSKGGVRALMQAVKKLKDGSDLAITPDGPKGPRHSISDGTIFASQKSGAPIVCMRIRAKNAWRLKSWDRHIVPKPFARVHFSISVPLDLSGLDLEQARKKLKEVMTTDEY